MDTNVNFLKRRPLSLASNSSAGSQAGALKNSEKRHFNGSFSGSSEGCVSDEAFNRRSIIRYASEPHLSNPFEPIQGKSSSLCDFYQYYFDQFLTAKSKKAPKHCLLEEKVKNEEGFLQSSTRQIVNEIVETEEYYVNCLLEIIQGYMHAMEKDSRVGSATCSKIFSNITSICSFNKNLLEEFKSCGSDVAQLASTFTRNHHNFLLYSTYCSNYPRCLEALERCMASSDSRHLLTSLQTSLCHKLPLASYLLMPIQRIVKYKLFLQNILNCYSSSSSRPLSVQPSSSSSSSPLCSKTQNSSSPLPQPSLSPLPQPSSSSSSSSSLQHLKLSAHQRSSPSPCQRSSPSPCQGSVTKSPLRTTTTAKSSSASLSSPSASSSSSPSSSLSSSSAAMEAVREALKCMARVLEHINQTNTLRARYNKTHTYKNKDAERQKERQKEEDRLKEIAKKNEFKKADVGDLLFKGKLHSGGGGGGGSGGGSGGGGGGGLLHLFVFSRAVMLSRKRSRNKHMVKMLFEPNDALLVEDLEQQASCFLLISILNPSIHVKLQAGSVEEKVKCCHHLKRVVSCDVTRHHHVVQACLRDVCTLKPEKRERVIDKSSFVSIESTHGQRRPAKAIEKPASVCHSTHHNNNNKFNMRTGLHNSVANNKQITNDNYLFTLKLPKTRKNGTHFLRGYKEAKCDDVCMEGCEGVYKRQPPSPPTQTTLLHSSSHTPLSPPIDTPLGGSYDSPGDWSACVDFFYEDKLMGALDCLSVAFDDSDFEDFTDSTSLDSAHDDQFMQSAF